MTRMPYSVLLGHPVLRAADASGPDCKCYPRTPILPTDLFVDRLEFEGQEVIGSLPRALRSDSPATVANSAHAAYPASGRDRPPPTEGPDKSVSHYRTREKIPVAYFTIYRSIRSQAFSFLRRATSSSRGFQLPRTMRSAGRGCSICRFQRLKQVGGMPSSLAVLLQLLPVRWTNCTVCSLNSFA